MKKITILLSFLIILMTGTLTSFPTQSYAAFPISNSQVKEMEKQVEEMEKQKTEIKTQKKISALQKKVSATTIGGADNGIYGILSFAMGVVGWTIAWVTGIGFLLLLGALITGIIGVGPRKKYKGLALAGLILGAAGVLIFLLAVLILAAWVL